MTTKTLKKFQGRLDSIGALLSAGCAVHCVLLPLLVTILPLFGLGFLLHGAFDVVMLTITIGLATASLCWGTRTHKQYRVLLLLAAAVVLFLIGFSHAHNQHQEVEPLKAVMFGLGGLCLASGHLLNRRLCRSCHDCC